ncbi:hypothetical protein Vadar_032074 [Vaccinium darrowii]|uniref:Uncharacterized protein n=1 Tax=Vaccinium darrowii TaxID=229202 RepID=A0ACB7XLI7_9ERIC|nr:hypothetical protein Vadar_032074 [Vaccinium darrowii]
MARWNDGGGGGGAEDQSSAVLILWVALLAFSLTLGIIIFSCADGISKDKAPATHTDTYGTGCAACGA